MVEIICSRSGLKFEAPNRRTKVHPEISWYTTHKNYEVRYPAIEVIERGKSEGWDTLEKFEEEIKKALNPPPPKRPDWDFECAWVAKILATDVTYRFKRIFLTKVDTEGRFNRFKITEDGIYECCYKSARGNETRSYYRVNNGEREKICLEEVEKLYPPIEPPTAPNFNGCIQFNQKLGDVGAIIDREDVPHIIVHVKSIDRWEDDDGITHTGLPGRDCMFSWTDYISYLRPATGEEIANFEQQQAIKKAKSDAQKRLAEIKKSISVNNGAISPESCDYPTGKEIVIKQGLYQANVLLVVQDDKLWALRYNGRDGDDWSYNNVAGTHVGSYISLNHDLELEIRQLCETLEING